MTALTGPLPDRRCAPTKQRPFPPRRLCCPAAQPVLRPPPTPTRPAIHFPGSPVIGRRAPAARSAGCRAGEGLPSSRRHYRCVPRPIRRGVPRGCASRLFAASVAFALDSGARLSLLPPLRTGPLTTPQASLHATDRTVAPPVTGPLTLGSDPARFQTKPPACYRASWQLPGPDSHRQATTSLRTEDQPWTYVTVPPPTLLGARKIEANSWDVFLRFRKKGGLTQRSEEMVRDGANYRLSAFQKVVPVHAGTPQPS